MVLEVRLDMAVAVGEGDPELRAVQEAGVRLGALLGVADRAAGGHEAQFARADRRDAAGRVAVQHLALVQPAHRLQAHVGVRRHLHPGLVGDVVRTVVIHEAPRADHTAAQVGQQSADLGGLAELHPARAEEFTDGLRHHETAAAAQGRNRFAIKIAHGDNLVPPSPFRQSADSSLVQSVSPSPAPAPARPAVLPSGK